jgi:hypothetical protein
VRVDGTRVLVSGRCRDGDCGVYEGCQGEERGVVEGCEGVFVSKGGGQPCSEGGEPPACKGLFDRNCRMREDFGLLNALINHVL